jgi:hypothetical protein
MLGRAREEYVMLEFMSQLLPSKSAGWFGSKTAATFLLATVHSSHILPLI